MKTCALRDLFVALMLALPFPATAAIELVPVLSGLSSPVFAGNAGDGSNRLFVIEQAGVIRVRQPGASSATTFLDIRPKIAFGGERGLLGLAFHPQYASNGRFYVDYTRAADGAIVIAEYRVSTDPNVADPATEKVLLTIPHPAFANHNGGMLAFGPDHLLYIGVGDGGSGNDPPNNAQNLDVLLGKILRIDVDRADAAAGTAYAVPADNPFVNTFGRDEIFAYGLRNPWRFSFDRVTGVQWVADVGQGTREEVDMPIVKGGNYGWRVYEGFECTGNDPSLCDPSRYRPPIFEYPHTGNRCSITGGYVYRGAQSALPGGTYVYGDYCSGEILAWNGATQSLLLATPHNIASFGEDEQGEIYVVALGGSVSRLAAATPCTFAISPSRETFTAGGGGGNITVTAPANCAWTARSNAAWIAVTSGATGTGNGSVLYAVAAYEGKPKSRTGTLTVAGQTFTVKQTKVRPLLRR